MKYIIGLGLVAFVVPYVAFGHNCSGCGEYATCDVVFVEDAVYGCGGIWENAGITNGAYLCGEGYSICFDTQWAMELGLTYQDCSNNSDLIAENYYYVSGVSSNGSLDCDSSGNNDLFGCASSTNGSNGGWLYFDPEAIDCGPFGAQMSTENAGNNGWLYGWEPWSGSNPDTQEFLTTRHVKKQDCSSECYFTDEVWGGVMCCLDQPNVTTTMINESTTDYYSAIVTIDINGTDFNNDKTYDDWRSRSIYQLLTDRFATSDGNFSGNCSDLSGYCGGTFKGITNKLSYIEDLGFDTIWISPIVSNTENGYHGYWAEDIYSVNSYFGSDADLTELSDELHARDMYLIIDIVCNHMGYIETSSYKNFSQFTPFNDSIYYHTCYNFGAGSDNTTSISLGCGTTDCGIDDYDNDAEVEICRLAGLPDLNTTNGQVRELFCDWILDVINDFMIDGIRIDTIKHVDEAFWQDFMACVTNGTEETEYNGGFTFSTGEYFDGDTTLLGDYQSDDLFTSLLSYPLYYVLKNVFLYDYSMSDIYSQILDYNEYFNDFSLLTGFLDNHDVDRWLCGNDDLSDDSMAVINLKNALLFLFTFNNIPILYYGTEQLFNGCTDPENREVLWTSEFDKTNTMYVYIKLLNQVRKKYEIYDYYDTFNIIAINDDYMIYNRGPNVLVCLTKYSSSGDNNVTINIGKNSLNNVLDSSVFCDALSDSSSDCFTVADDNSGPYTISLPGGVSKMYVAENEMSTTSETTSMTTGVTTSDSGSSGNTESSEEDSGWKDATNHWFLACGLVWLWLF